MYDHLIYSISMSVQDLFDAPAAEEKIETLFHRLDKTVGKISSQEVLASSKTHCYVPQVLSQRGGRHGLGKRTLRMHGSSEEKEQSEGGNKQGRQAGRTKLVEQLRSSPYSWHS